MPRAGCSAWRSRSATTGWARGGIPQITGKGRSGDLRRRKLTYPVVAAYEVATPPRRRELRRLFREREPGGEFRLRALLDDLGGPALTAGVPMVLARDAIAALSRSSR